MLIPVFGYHTTLNLALRQDFVCKKHAGTPKGIYDFGFTIYEIGIFPEIAFCFSDSISEKNSGFAHPSWTVWPS